MAMHVPKAPGFAQMLKDGAKHYSGLDEAVYRNIEACKELAATTRSAFGPLGQSKMVINHIEKLFVTNDAATILRELEVQHPAAKLLVMASQQQEQEVGDGTNFVLVFAGALLENAEMLIRMGLSVTEVTEGYEQALKKALDILPGLVCGEQKNLRDKEGIVSAIKTSVMSKQYGNEDFIAGLIAEACQSVLSQKLQFNVDNVRVSKILGSGVHQSEVIQGMVFKRNVEGDVTKAEKCKIAVYSCPLDVLQTETKGTIKITSAEELMNFSKGEENQVEEQIKGIAESGCTVVVSGGKVGELAQHYCNKYKLMVVRLMSKWDLRRLCRSVGATPLPRITPPTADEAGYCDNVYIDEIGDTAVIVFRQKAEESAVATIMIRGSTDNVIDDIERAIDDGVNTFKALTKDPRMVPGAGATEIELAKQISTFGESCPGLEQYSIVKFAESLEVVPKALSENAGAKGTEILSKLYAAHQEGKQSVGVDVESVPVGVRDALETNIKDLYINKYWGMKYATTAACTVLKVDQVSIRNQVARHLRNLYIYIFTFYFHFCWNSQSLSIKIPMHIVHIQEEMPII
ncbi:T-complex protein 1 subunit theta-like [Ostrea edulis]|uniref:T-complex protein 1 subunit theta-like n=1 Tax=Ostrea edulis TaxID=37623 RepID=UPI0024AF89F9|nr:T-complex protein 1 subunit theta-like [Ostrea edulis]